MRSSNALPPRESCEKYRARTMSRAWREPASDRRSFWCSAERPRARRAVLMSDGGATGTAGRLIRRGRSSAHGGGGGGAGGGGRGASGAAGAPTTGRGRGERVGGETLSQVGARPPYFSCPSA